MELLRPVSQILTTEIPAGVAASPAVISRKRCGRHAVGITATAITRIVDNPSKTNGIVVKKDETVILPVTSDRYDQFYVTAPVVLTEFF